MVYKVSHQPNTLSPEPGDLKRSCLVEISAAGDAGAGAPAGPGAPPGKAEDGIRLRRSASSSAHSSFDQRHFGINFGNLVASWPALWSMLLTKSMHFDLVIS